MSPIARTEEYLACLHSLAEPPEALEKHGFIFKQLDEEALLGKRKCSGCRKPMWKLNSRPPPTSGEQEPIAGTLELQSQPTDDRPKKMRKRASTSSASVPEDDGSVPSSARTKDSEKPVKKEPQFRCRYHLDQCVDEVWTCCNEHVKGEPCSGTHEHVPIPQELHELTALHQCYPTPSLLHTHRPYLCDAFAVDCEMGTATSGDSELIRITMVDYFSGAILIDNYVEPDVPMLHFNTKYSGVTWADLKNARKQGNILQGKAHARQAICDYVSLDTLVIGHAVINDFRALKWLHVPVVDSFITEDARVKAKEAEEAEEAKIKEEEEARLKEAEEARLELEIEKGSEASALHDLEDMSTEDAAASTPEEKPRVRKPGNLSLKTLAKRYLERNIQNKGKAGHDSLEDAMAAREIVHCSVLRLMEEN